MTQEMRLEELTSLLDAMTGGWYADQLNGSRHAKGQRTNTAASDPAQ